MTHDKIVSLEWIITKIEWLDGKVVTLPDKE